MPMSEISPQLLASLSPLDRLPDAERRKLLPHVRVDTLAKGQKFPGRNARSWLSYVLDGDMEIVRHGATIRRLRAEPDGGEVRSPVFGMDDEMADHALCLSPVRLLSIRKQPVQALLQEQPYQVEETPLAPGEASLLARIFPALQSGEIKLPSMPDVAVRVRLLAQDEGTGISEIAKVVQADPAIATRLIQAANSAAYRGAKPVDTIREAITRLGLKRSANLALGLAMHSAFSSRVPMIAAQMRKNWELSVQISASAYVIARHTRLMDPERALLGGLVHRIGAVPILQYAQDLAADETEIEQALQRYTPLFSGILLKHWEFDPEFVTAAEESGQWQRDPGPRPDLCDIIHVARLYANLRSDTPEPLPEPAQVPGFGKLGLGDPDSARALQVLEEAAEEIASIRAFLS